MPSASDASSASNPRPSSSTAALTRSRAMETSARILLAPECAADSTRKPWRRAAETYARRGLTPLIFGHVNPYGGFELDMDARLPLGDGASREPSA